MGFRIRCSALAFLTWPLFGAPLSPALLQQIKDAALRFSLDPKLVRAIVQVESDFNPLATSRKKARGLMQVMPQTAHKHGIDNPYHPYNNLMGACEYLRELLNDHFSGDLIKALAAYNAGVKNVEKYGGIPPFPETQQYVKKVMKIYRELK